MMHSHTVAPWPAHLGVEEPEPAELVQVPASEGLPAVSSALASAGAGSLSRPARLSGTSAGLRRGLVSVMGCMVHTSGL